MSKTLTALLLLAMQSADEEGKYTIKHKLEEMYDNYTNPQIITSSGDINKRIKEAAWVKQK